MGVRHNRCASAASWGCEHEDAAGKAHPGPRKRSWPAAPGDVQGHFIPTLQVGTWKLERSSRGVRSTVGSQAGGGCLSQPCPVSCPPQPRQPAAASLAFQDTGDQKHQDPWLRLGQSQRQRGLMLQGEGVRAGHPPFLLCVSLQPKGLLPLPQDPHPCLPWRWEGWWQSPRLQRSGRLASDQTPNLEQASLKELVGP